MVWIMMVSEEISVKYSSSLNNGCRLCTFEFQLKAEKYVFNISD